MRISKFIGTSLCFLAVCAMTSCGEEGVNADSYFRANVTGPSWTGHVDLNSQFISHTASALISDSGDPLYGDILFISFGEEQGQSVGITIPAEKRVTELTLDHEVFGMALGDANAGTDGVGLMSKSLSMDLKVLKTTRGPVVGFNIPSKIEGSFTGVMVRTYIDTAGMVAEEPHLVDGEFKFFQ